MNIVGVHVVSFASMWVSSCTIAYIHSIAAVLGVVISGDCIRIQVAEFTIIQCLSDF